MDTTAKTGSLHFTLSTFLYSLYSDNIKPTAESIINACANIEAVGNKPLQSLAIQSVQEVLEQQFGHSPDASNVAQLIENSYGADSYTSATPNELGKALVDALSETLAENADYDTLCAWLNEQYSASQFKTSFEGDTREEQISSIRKYVYQKGRPWLAEIADRRNDQLITQWVMVEDFTDSVTCMDPYPWDDIDEEYTLSLHEFMIRWELAGARSIRQA